MKRIIAKILFKIGIKPKRSTNIAGLPSYGYGKLDNNGF